MLQTRSPGGMVTDGLPPKVTSVSVSLTTLAEYSWSPTVTLRKVTGFVPKTFEKRMRIVLPQRSGLHDEEGLVDRRCPGGGRVGKGKARSGWMFATAYWMGWPGVRTNGCGGAT